MIITSLHAVNVLKYRTLDLDDIPERGIIAISGENESGKSTVGETICFALFGRTYSLDESELSKIIFWGESECSVVVTFKLKDGDSKHYELSRYLDHNGNHSARLGVVGDSENPFARGVTAVYNELQGMLGFNVDEFLETFYLAQREITSPHPHSSVVKNMAGIASMELVADDFLQEINEAEALLQENRQHIGEYQEKLREIALQPEHLGNLQAELEQVNSRQQQQQQQQEQLVDVVETYCTHHKTLLATRSKISGSRFFTFLFMTVALAAGGLWGVLTRLPEHPIAQKASALAAQLLPQVTPPQLLQGLLIAAAVSGFFYLIFLTRLLGAGTRRKALMSKGDPLAQQLSQAIAEDRLDAKALDEVEQQQLQRLVERVSEMHAHATEVNQLVAPLHDAFVATQNALRQQQQQLQAAIENEGLRATAATELQTLLNNLQNSCDELQQRIELRQLGNELLQGATAHLSHRFNRTIRELVSLTLPSFTQGRYEHLQIDDEALSVEIFSSEKRAFMTLDEVSSGTQRQIMLALRVALAQTLVIRLNRGRQFLFLDEPFAFFDAQRTVQALEVLPLLSQSLSQIWIIAQAFPEGVAFAKSITCERGQVTLYPKSLEMMEGGKVANPHELSKPK
ncbi:MAG: AAA family ATPase [Gammaproteobacteria bacterium]|nr:AAA family ATPase [Gammaproteobacteria bacterium]